jgi:hypothetical protein
VPNLEDLRTSITARAARETVKRLIQMFTRQAWVAVANRYDSFD